MLDPKLSMRDSILCICFWNSSWKNGSSKKESLRFIGTIDADFAFFSLDVDEADDFLSRSTFCDALDEADVDEAEEDAFLSRSTFCEVFSTSIFCDSLAPFSSLVISLNLFSFGRVTTKTPSWERLLTTSVFLTSEVSPYCLLNCLDTIV